MGLLSKIFGKKEIVYDRFEPTEEQEQFLKEDSEMNQKKKAAQKKEAETAKPGKDVKAVEVKPAEKPKAEPKKAAEKPQAEPKKVAEKPKAEPKKVAEKPKTEPKKTAEKPQTEPKKAAEKPKAEPKKAAEKPKAEPKKVAEKPKAEPKKAEKTPVQPSGDELQDDSPEVKGAVAVQESKETANGKFDIRRAKDGRYFFSLYASNHAVIAYSQIYSSVTAVNTGISSVISNSTKAEIEDNTLKKPVALPCPKWEIYIDKAKQYRFRLYAPNGQCICHSSHGYSTKTGCKGGMDSIKRFAAEAKVNKTYLK